MNITEQIIALCAEQGVSLAVQNDQLEVVFDEMPPQDLLEQLRQHKAAVIHYLQSHQQQQHWTRISALHETTAPLSFGQKRLWFVDQLEQGSAHYNLPLALQLKGVLVSAHLKTALDLLVERHEILRTTYDNSGTRQVIHAAGGMPMQQLDWSGQDAEASLSAMLTAAQLSAFDLSQQFPVRAVLVKLTEQHHVLLVVVHHIASDGWSLGIIVRELAALYSDLVADREPVLAPLTVQYADYAYWQQANQDVFEQQLDFWRLHLAQAPALHRLSTDRPRPPQQSFAGSVVRTRLPTPLVQQLQQSCQQQDVTTFMFCYAVYALLIARYSDEQDVVIGCPVANRHQAVIEPLVGYFANTIVLRSRLRAELTFSQWLQDTKTMILDVLQHQQVPFEMVVERMQPERNLAHSPLFQLMFSFHSHGKAQLTLAGLQLEELSLHAGTVKTDLELAITEVDGSYHLDWNFSTALFDENTIARLATGYQVLLQAILTDPTALLTDYPVMTADEQQQLESWGHLSADHPSGSTDIATDFLPALIEQTVLRQPDSVAVQYKDRCLTYRQLAQLSDRVAAYLQLQGIRSGQVVAVEMSRTEWLVVALLGVLKAGACYLPLEPDYPQSRRDYMRQDSQATLILTDPLLEQIIAAPESVDFKPDAAASLAYVLYTSGSTGQPKGVMVSHRSVVHFLQAMAADLQSGGNWLAVTGVAFDISVLEIFGSLVYGLKLVIWSPDQMATVAEMIASYQITHLQCTPSFAQMHLAELASAVQLKSLRHLFVGGEIFPAPLASQLMQRTDASIHNMYGPTEATVWATSYRLRQGDNNIPLGTPLTGYQLKVMSQAGRLLPPGAVGELYIGGPGVAAGYLHQPELTTQRFVVCPQSQTRWYRTGDQVRWLPDGQLQFLGRFDSQIKLRGHRIEPDEIAAQLRQMTSLINAVVIAEHPTNGITRLVAYVQPVQWPTATAELMEQCKEFLAGRLPSYMVPSVFIVLEKLPLTLNGKLNKAALPAAELVSAVPVRGPQSETEQALVLIWSELLAVPAGQVNCQSSFFDLGGHSILLTRLLAALQEQFGIRLTIREVFEHASIEALAVIIEQRRQTAGSDTFNLLSRTNAGQSEEFVL